MAIKNIIFDFGGVLIDWNPVYLYEKVFDTKEDMDFFLNNICTSDWNVNQDAGYPLKKATKELQEKHPDYSDKIGMFYGRWTEMLGGTIDENVQVLKKLKPSFPIFGLTNWSAETIPFAIERYDFFKLLDGMVVSGKEKIIKPDRRLYQILIDKYQLNPEESLFIDDNIHNIKTADDMGFVTIHLTPETNLEETVVSMGLL
ncbi:MAG: HAD family phosphatase [Petrimonas sp.]|jgi:2-haloacid dehalogenase|nr:HAD family phosphatase [Dysgonamonadaceae bacterium]MEA4995069.1 HAD family phosphatase [Petrimonas sp.]MDD3308951.1 HAD family phosphatase [Dysgonamonadaceae bacterium]MDD3900805.1 HAD family phosphatase [Dysgonamonadaceae bacterium]MDD4398079.1 HAD family phosphatase [Dysgonamonadaceae bacterium]